MGTNFYGKQIAKLKELEEKQVRIESEIRGQMPNSSIELDDIISQYFKQEKEKIKEIHIGKSSAGWQFLFNYNGGQYYTNKQSLLDWLDTVEISDEYGRIQTKEEFMDGLFDRKWEHEYAKKHKSASKYAEMYIEVDGLEFLDSEFC